MANRFKERRKELHLSAEEAAVKIGCKLGTLYSWERGDTKPQAESLANVAKAYDVSTDWLLDLTE